MGLPTLTLPGHPSSGSSCLWGLKRGKRSGPLLAMGLCCSKQRLRDFLLLRDQSSSQRMLRLRDFSQCVDSLGWITTPGTALSIGLGMK